MFVDYEKSVFRLGLLDEEALLQAPISSGSCALSAEAKGLIGTGVAIFVVVVLVGLLAFFLWRKLRERERELRDYETRLSRQGDELDKAKGDIVELRKRPAVQPPPPRPPSPVISKAGSD